MVPFWDTLIFGGVFKFAIPARMWNKQLQKSEWLEEYDIDIDSSSLPNTWKPKTVFYDIWT